MTSLLVINILLSLILMADSAKQKCQESDFRCRDGTCIPFFQRCNLIRDCPDGSDELSCHGPNRTCSPEEFTCRSGDCIPRHSYCDRRNDCPDGSDEYRCPPSRLIHGRHLCPKGEFLCSSGQCIHMSNRCDGKIDCPADISDEIGCMCNSNEWQCDDGQCIPDSKRCDGKVDCPNDSSDETSRCSKCSSEQFQCTESGECIDYNKKCDGSIDCLDKSDEKYCMDYCNRTTMFQCASIRGACIPISQRCDGIKQCNDASDEQNCDCREDELRCDDNTCYRREGKCDKKRDCPDGSDEKDCSYCRSDQFSCPDGRCLSMSQVCNGIMECSNGEDERNCRSRPDEDYCEENYFYCGDDSTEKCVYKTQICDGTQECSNGADEANCHGDDEDNGSPAIVPCLPEEFQCHDGVCISMAYYCDTIPDCNDLSDENNCTRHCGPNDVVCGDGTCVKESKKCDGVNDCRDGSDEAQCYQSCDWTEFQCRSGHCVPASAKCNRRQDCPDGSDETDCPPRPPRQCESWEYKCISGDQCISKSYHCDGKRDCRDGSDEENCAGAPYLDLKTYPNEQTITEGREVVFQCRDEGPGHIPVRWTRGETRLPPGSRDYNGRLEMPNIQISDSGTYYCEAIGVPPSTPGSRVPVYLKVEPSYHPIPSFVPACGPDQATCYNRECIPKNKVCDGTLDCGDGSDESRCNPQGCEPNEFRCENRKCIRKSWVCDSDNDCGDGSDERYCEEHVPGARCNKNEFECRTMDQCIPKWFHCDTQNDCQDGSDEIGCYALRIEIPPPPLVILNIGDIFIINCTAVGVPIPTISWRLNWGHIPPKCTTRSENGVGTLTCPNIQESDQGAYSCEALDARQSIIATPDTHLQVRPGRGPVVCPPGTFHNAPTSSSQCIPCFCFGATTDCHAAYLYLYQLPPPRNTFRIVSVQVQSTGIVDIIRHEMSSYQAHIRTHDNGFKLYSPTGSRMAEDIYPYFSMPENYHGNQLRSYGGALRYKVRFLGRGDVLQIPDVILSGNGHVLTYTSRQRWDEGVDNEVSVRFIVGDWSKVGNNRTTYATREDIMMALVQVDNILIRSQYMDGAGIETEITNIRMDSSGARDSNQGLVEYVEECRCPAGYSGPSCEECAPGFVRRQTGRWLGLCVEEREPCPVGTYGDPQRGRPCEACPCPLTSPSNQFGKTCHLDTDGDVTCDCPTGYIGRRCERCRPGFSGNPLIPGGSCQPAYCNAAGSELSNVDPQTGRCSCKEFVTGDKCDQCKANTFHLSTANKYGCISCFCMGITNECGSSSLYRDQVRVAFTRGTQEFHLASNDNFNDLIPVLFEPGTREIVFRNFEPKVYYWVLPEIFLGDKVTAYGGNLKYTLRYVPAPGGQSSKNNAPDVEIYSLNGVHLSHYSKEAPEPDSEITIQVPLLEQYWQRDDGAEVEREQLLMALADLSAIYIKATYTTNTREAALISVSMDTATERNTGLGRAVEVEDCRCPVGYRGYSCEDCDAGYTRSDEGVYLRLCEPCNCNGYSSECHPETGECINCQGNRVGDNCERCAPGYRENYGRCEPDEERCYCDPRGSISSHCTNGRCTCKVNVIGDRCDQCRPGTFALAQSHPEGCLECFCWGHGTSCQSSNLYIEQIPLLIMDDDHGFTLTDSNRTEVIRTNFRINTANNEISYDLSPRRSHRLFWSLPSKFTGDKVTSYGGQLTFTLRFHGPTDAYVNPDTDIILIGNGISVYWNFDSVVRPNEPKTVTVPLMEGIWKRLDAKSGESKASRTDMLKILSNLDAILIRASLSSQARTTFISDVSMDTAVTGRTGAPASRVENCRCPPEYRGTSCQLCSEHYYRDFDQICKPCPCNNNEESCTIGPDYNIRCTCQPGYTGTYCESQEEDSGIIVIMKPASVNRVPYNTIITFNCSYQSSEQMRITINLVRRPGASQPRLSESYYAPSTWWYGASRVRDVKITPDLAGVECVVEDRNGIRRGYFQSIIRPVDGGESYATIEPPRQPTITITISEPLIKIVEVGSTVRYHCKGRSAIASQRPVRLDWSKQGGFLPPGRAIDDKRGILIITDVRETDSGIYVCTASDGYSTESQYVTLNVGRSPSSPPSVRIIPPYIDTREGDSVEARCEATGNPTPTISWRRDGNLSISYQVQVYEGLIRFPSIGISDQGNYECIASNNAGSQRQILVISVRESDSGQIPSIRLNVQPKRFTGVTGDHVRILCQIPGVDSETHRLIWTREENRPLPHSATQADGILSIHSASPADSGIYVCLATHTGTGRNVGKADATVEISNYRRPPIVTIEPEIQTVLQGTNAELFCRVTGDDVRIKWYKVEDRNNILQGTAPILRINNVKVSDRGFYVCEVESAGGPGQQSAILEVERLEAPTIDIYPSHQQTFIQGTSALIQCRLLSGIPKPTVYWTRVNNESLPAEVHQQANGVLRFDRIQLSHGGEYICHAANIGGETTTTALIIVHSRPNITIPSGKVIRLQRGDKLNLECRAEGFPTPYVTWRKGISYSRTSYERVRDLVPASPDFSIYEVYSVTAEDEGVYSCEAKNDAGEITEVVQVDVIDDGGPARGDIGGEDDGPGGEEGVETERESWMVVGGNNQINCRLRDGSDDRIQLQWVRADGQQFGANVYQRNGTLYIRGATRDLEGEYSCVGRDRNGAVLYTASTYLRVAEPLKITLEPQRQVVKPGDYALIRCIATGEQPIDITWEPIERSMPPTVTVNGGVIEFNEIRVSDEGRYLCRARNRDAESDAVAEVVVKEFDIQRPRVTAVNRVVNVNEGKNVDLQCTTDTSARIDWRKMDSEISPRARKEGGTLVFDQVRPEDSGNYSCIAYSRTGSVATDYIALTVNRRPYKGPGDYECEVDEFECKQLHQCIRLYEVCDGRTQCWDGSDERYCPGYTGQRTYRHTSAKKSHHSQHQTGADRIKLKIQPSIDVIRVGSTLDLRCITSGVSPRDVTWNKLGTDRMAPNVLISDNVLRISGVTPNNAGVYKCSARSHKGVVEDTYLLNVQDNQSDDATTPSPAIETKTAYIGDHVIMSCQSQLEEPVTFSWSKQGSHIHSGVSINQGTLTIPEVSLEDAGMYICTASNPVIKMQIPTILTVTGSVPSFNQDSVIALPTIPEAYLQFEVSLRIKPEQPDGLILYNGQRPEADFMSLGLRSGIPEFQFDVGSGPAVISGNEPLEMGKWHHIKLLRNRKKGEMWINDGARFTGESKGRHQGMDFDQELYVGGVPNFDDIQKTANYSKGFKGCISDLKVGKSALHKLEKKQALRWENIGACVSICSERENLCKNHGACQEAHNQRGHVCICPIGFSGYDCGTVGETCYPGICGDGKCENRGQGIMCKCPHGKAGSRCEQNISINIPSFRNNAYMAYPTPRLTNRVRMNMKINPANDADGVILYSGHNNGEGDFISLVVRNRHLEYRFGSGLDSTVVRSNKQIRPGEWTRVVIQRSPQEVHLFYGDDVAKATPIYKRAEKLETPLYVGGYDNQIRLNPLVGVYEGFNGCIDIDMGQTVESSNVVNCESSPGDPCLNNPCRNRGVCQPTNGGFVCQCPLGFSGPHCEEDLCSRESPCENGGACVTKHEQPGYACQCSLGYAGTRCEHRVEVTYDASFRGDGYVELSKDLLPHLEPESKETIEFEISGVTHPDGLLFWQGQEQHSNRIAAPQDYLAIAVVNGMVELSYELGSGPGKIRVDRRVDDGRKHKIQAWREGGDGVLRVDGTEETGNSLGQLVQLNTNSNIFIGGAPNIETATGGRFMVPFSGCIHRLRLQQSGDIHFGSTAISAVNLLPCTKFYQDCDAGVTVRMLALGVSGAFVTLKEYKMGSNNCLSPTLAQVSTKLHLTA